MGAKQRNGKIVARPLGRERDDTFARFVQDTVERGETVYTDKRQSYKTLKRHYDHETAKHSQAEHVREASTSTASNRSGRCSSG